MAQKAASVALRVNNEIRSSKAAMDLLVIGKFDELDVGAPTNGLRAQGAPERCVVA